MVTCDGRTENGIPYVTRLYLSNYEYETVINDLNGLVLVRKQIMTGGGSVSSYTIGSRSLSKQALSASEVLDLWDKLWAKKERLEEGRSAARKAVGVVLRDW